MLVSSIRAGSKQGSNESNEVGRKKGLVGFKRGSKGLIGFGGAPRGP